VVASPEAQAVVEDDAEDFVSDDDGTATAFLQVRERGALKKANVT